jgi:hypothetical protein
MATSTHSPETNSGVVTSWLPVSTPWPAVPQCSAEIYSQIGGGSAIAFDPFFGQSINGQITCLPPAATLWWNQVYQTPAQTITSLGPFACPELYTTGTTSALNSLSTFIGCCPSYVKERYNYPEHTADRPIASTPSSTLSRRGLSGNVSRL